MLAQELLVLLRTFAVRNRSATVDLRQFLAAMPKGQAQLAEVEAAVAELAEKAALVVSTEADIAAAMALDGSVLAIGAQSSLTGGATPVASEARIHGRTSRRANR